MAKVMTDIENYTMDDFLLGNKAGNIENTLKAAAEEAVDQEEQTEEAPASSDAPNIFEVTDLSSATEAQRRAMYHQEKIDEIDEVVKGEIDILLEKIEKLNAWAEDAKSEYVERQSRYVAMLQDYLKREIEAQEAKGKKKITKTMKLPYGKIAFKKQQPKFERNDDELMNYALDHEFVKMPEPQIDWSALKKDTEIVGTNMISKDGEIVPGVTVHEQVDKFEIKWEGK